MPTEEKIKLEKEWQESQPHFSQRELLDIFPDLKNNETED